MPRSLHIDLSEDKPGSLSYEVTGLERLVVECDGSSARLFANRKACATLAQIFGKLSSGDYEPGFHVHVRANFDDDAARVSGIIKFSRVGRT
jgi:hypothetical protein